MTYREPAGSVDGVEFYWDPVKNRANRKKHGLSFEEAVRVFDTPEDAAELYDADHSQAEERDLR